MPSPERMSPESQRARLIPKLPEANIEPLDEEEQGEKTESASFTVAEAGSQEEVQATVKNPERRSAAEKQSIAHETGKILLQKKIEAGADLQVLKESLKSQLEEIDMTIEELEEAGDQPVQLEDEFLKREKVLAGLAELAKYEKKSDGKEAA